MNEQELIARAREVGTQLSARNGDLDRLAGALLAELTDRLDDCLAWRAMEESDG